MGWGDSRLWSLGNGYDNRIWAFIFLAGCAGDRPPGSHLAIRPDATSALLPAPYT